MKTEGLGWQREREGSKMCPVVGGRGAARWMVQPPPEIDEETEGEDKEKLCGERGGVQG